MWLIAILGGLIVVAAVSTILNNKKPADPTLTAAPPIVATPEHPIILHTKSPEVLALEMKQNGMPIPGDKTGQPTAGQ